MVAMDKTEVLWVTGPAGSGKDEACRVLEKLGFVLVDADKIGHKILEKKKGTVKKVFGAGVMNRGKVDRKLLGQTVFGSRAALKKLNAIVHPDLIKKIRAGILASKHKKIAINAALYKELCAACPDAPVIAVLASRGARVKRLLLSRKAGLDKVLALISAQQKDSYYKKIADFVILNDSSLEQLEREVGSVISRMSCSG